jgi:ribonuclease HI
MIPYHVGVAYSCHDDQTSWSYVFEDGESFQEVLAGDAKTSLCDALKTILSKAQGNSSVVLLCYSPLLVSCRQMVSNLLPHVVIMTPYDPFSKDLQNAAYNNLQKVQVDIEYPVRVYASDASVTRRIATWAWVSRNCVSGALEFDYGVCKTTNVAVAEALAIMHTISAHRQHRHQPLVVLSDCKNAIKLVEEFLCESARTDHLLATVPDVALPHGVRNRVRTLHKTGSVTLQWVKGHADNELNVYADQIATYVRRRIQQSSHTFVSENPVIIKNEIEQMLQGMNK